MISNDFTPKKPNIFICEKCDFSSSQKKDFNRHMLTKKHNSNDYQCFSTEKPKKTPYECMCGKIYKDNSGLWRHKQKCKTNIINIDNESPDTELTDKQIIMMLIKDNSEFKKMMIEQQKSLIEIAKEKAPINSTNTNSNSNNTTNCNNKIFNLQVYLNETCKDAINLTEFIDSIKVQIKDLEKVGEKGYSEGVSKIFIDNLNQLQKKLRPIHCSDSKRETIYIKENNQWTKDDDNKSILTKAIKQVANKNIKKITDWQKLHPEYKDSSSKQNDRYLKIVLNSMSGSTKEEAEKNYDKIIKNVIKETIIDK
jgi:hypothetical protein